MALYWTNYKWTGYLPINSNDVFDNTGLKYNLTKIIKADATLHESKHKGYSPPYISTGNLLTTGAGFALYTLALAYILLTEWNVITEACRKFYSSVRHRGKSNYERYTDPISKMMSAYPEFLIGGFWQYF